jgi:hypothetical protein
MPNIRLEANEIAVSIVPSGHREEKVPARAVNVVLEYRSEFRTGYHRTTAALARSEENSISISGRTMRKIFDVNDLYLSHPGKTPPPDHIKRDGARFCGEIWHTDLRYWKSDE